MGEKMLDEPGLTPCVPNSAMDFNGIKRAIAVLKAEKAETKGFTEDSEDNKAALKAKLASGVNLHAINTNYPSAYLVFTSEQREIMRHHKPKCSITKQATLTGAIWKLLSFEKRKLYEAVAEKCRKNPESHLSFKTFAGIQEYKRMLGFPFLPPSTLEPIE